MDGNTNTVVVGIFDDRYQAEQAVDELEHAGFSHHDVGFAIRGHDVVEGGMITDATGAKDVSGAIKGATAGAVAGGILGALAAVVVPPLGPVLVGGMLATAAGFAGTGAAVGGILETLTGLGVSEEEALHYEKEFNAGKAVVTVHAGTATDAATTAAADRAVTIIRRHGGFVRRDQIPPQGPQPQPPLAV
ncbi:MAG TPA: general stress protein [Tepidisphaeraceae bacterium]